MRALLIIGPVRYYAKGIVRHEETHHCIGDDGHLEGHISEGRYPIPHAKKMKM